MTLTPRPWASDEGRVVETASLNRPTASTSTGHLFNRMYPLSSDSQAKSPIPASRPIRSSPLAGPALSASRFLRNAACSSTPDLSQQEEKPSKSYAFGLFQRSASSSGHRPREEDGRCTSPDAAGKRKRLKLRKHRPDRPVSSPPLSNPAGTPPRRLAASPSRPPIANAPKSTRRHSSAPFQSSGMPTLGTHFRVPAVAAQRAEDTWLTSSPWGEIPRFNRLGLRSPNVVLPLSAKEYHRRQSLSPAKLSAPQARRPIPINLDPSHRRSRSFSDVYQVPPPPSLLRQASEPVVDASSGSHSKESWEESYESFPSLTST
ncbi:hypothetical protein BKA70DRAFT_1424505 [Coprinopsis sp. MPI-PUGE-AT-0042]|nr:hypothetical protein BKA70DRAFT_1424505 [Coprinopsis sp. MPI-PUGE-AT-0042]